MIVLTVLREGQLAGVRQLIASVRQVIVDTETTGLESSQGHRVIEIGCVELVDRQHTTGEFHVYLNPDREIDPGAQSVHGITSDFLQDKPRFGDICQDFLAFVDGAEVIIHNAPFDVGFINEELKRHDATLGGIEDYCTVTDSLSLARDLHPGQRNSLDALCSRYSVDNSQRDVHGAVLDARLLADVYLRMTGGQTSLAFATSRPSDVVLSRREVGLNRMPLRVIRATESELVAHQERLESMELEGDGGCLWTKLEQRRD